MGCVSSSFLEEDRTATNGTAFAHHIVSLTSTTYGLLSTLDPPRKTEGPPGGELSIVLYTTSLHTIRKTFEDCNRLRALLSDIGVAFKERDVSMDMGFRRELEGMVGFGFPLPRVFVKGRDLGGVEEVVRLHESGGFVGMLEGVPKGRRGGGVCDGCGGVGFLNCFGCHGGRKKVVVVVGGKGRSVVVRCEDCNENGLVVCPICC